jgi:DNA gyrase subunit A
MIVRDGYEVMLISRDGTVIRTAADGISRMGRPTQGVRLMNLRGDDTVSSIARVSEPQPVGVAGEEATDADLEADDDASPDGEESAPE